MDWSMRKSKAKQITTNIYYLSLNIWNLLLISYLEEKEEIILDLLELKGFPERSAFILITDNYNNQATKEKSWLFQEPETDRSK